MGRWHGLPTRHQVGNCSLGDLDSQFEQLAMSPWCFPERGGVRHLKNKVTDLRADRMPTGTFTSGLEFPKQLETLSVPSHDSFGLPPFLKFETHNIDGCPSIDVDRYGLNYFFNKSTISMI